MSEQYRTIKLDKSLYRGEGGFLAGLESLDPSERYRGTGLEGLDAFERQLKRFGIRVSGPDSDPIAKFFATADSAALFPEYVARAVARGAKDSQILGEICAARTEISSMDYRSITGALDDDDLSADIPEGGSIPEVSIVLSEQLIRMKKRGRILSASYEALRFQRADVVTVALRQIGMAIAKAQLRDAVALLIGGDGASVPAADTVSTAGTSLVYGDLLHLWDQFEEFEMNLLLASHDMVPELLGMPELRDPANGLHFQSTGAFSTPLGATLIRSSAVPPKTLVALDRRFALEMVSAGGVQVDYDKLIDTQLERAAVTCISGFSKIFPDAVKVLERQ